MKKKYYGYTGRKRLIFGFEIPHKLYGREAEIEMLVDAFERAADGTSEQVWSVGIQDRKILTDSRIRKSITGKGLFVSGKFDQFEEYTLLWNNPGL